VPTIPKVRSPQLLRKFHSVNNRMARLMTATQTIKENTMNQEWRHGGFGLDGSVTMLFPSHPSRGRQAAAEQEFVDRPVARRMTGRQVERPGGDGTIYSLPDVRSCSGQNFGSFDNHALKPCSDLLISDGCESSGVIAKLFAKSMRPTGKAGWRRALRGRIERILG
jgi:hypothetical protein